MARGPRGAGFPPGRLLPLLPLLSLALGVPRAPGADGECRRGAGAARGGGAAARTMPGAPRTLPRPWAGLARSLVAGRRWGIGGRGSEKREGLPGGLLRLRPGPGLRETNAQRPGPRPRGTWREWGPGAS